MNRRRRMEQRYSTADGMMLMVLMARLSLREAEQREAMWHARRSEHSVETRQQWVLNARNANRSIRILYRRIRQVEHTMLARQGRG